MSFRKTFLPAVILSVICLICAAALALTDLFTADKIAEVERERYLASAAAVLPAGASLSEIANEQIEGFVGKDDSGAVIGYVIKTASRGYGGDVTCVVGFDPQGRILGLSVSAPDETPGLGSNVQKETFTDQFIGMTGSPVLGENVDSVTGATYSSRAVADAVTQAVACFEMLTKGE